MLEQPAIDLAAIGEGEQTFLELLVGARDAGRTAEGIAGLWTRGGSLPAPRPALTDLDIVNSPYIEGILDAAEEQTMLMETSRGCRYRCKFCYYPKSYDSISRMTVEQIEANLRHACRQGVKEIYLLDPTLNQRPDFAGFLRLLARGNPDRQFTYSAELRAEGINAETARLLREANFHEVEVGLQSIDPEAQKLMGRRVSLEAFERGARAMLDEGIRVRVDLILGLPGDTVDSVRRGPGISRSPAAVQRVAGLQPLRPARHGLPADGRRIGAGVPAAAAVLRAEDADARTGRPLRPDGRGPGRLWDRVRRLPPVEMGKAIEDDMLGMTAAGVAGGSTRAAAGCRSRRRDARHCGRRFSAGWPTRSG